MMKFEWYNIPEGYPVSIYVIIATANEPDKNPWKEEKWINLLV